MKRMWPSEWAKSPVRGAALHSVMVNSVPVLMLDGEERILVYSKETVAAALSGNKELLRAATVIDTDGNRYPLSHIMKTAVFGGSNRDGLRRERTALSDFRERVRALLLRD